MLSKEAQELAIQALGGIPTENLSEKNRNRRLAIARTLVFGSNGDGFMPVRGVDGSVVSSIEVTDEYLMNVLNKIE